LNNTYGYDFNKWFSDRFRKREKLLNVKNYLKIKKTKEMIYFESGWGKKTNTRQHISQKDFEDTNIAIMEMKQWCKKHDIKCYIAYIPNYMQVKRSVIGLKNDVAENDNIAQRLNDYFKSKTFDFEIIDTHHEVVSRKFDTFYLNIYNPDVHPTDFGSYLVYKKTMEAIKNDIPDVKISTEDDYNIYCDGKMMYYHFYMNLERKISFFKNNLKSNKMNNKCYKNDYKYFLLKNIKNPVVTKNTEVGFSIEKSFTTDNENAIDKRISIIGTSYINGYSMHFLHSFKGVQKLRSNDDAPKEYCKYHNCFSLKFWEKRILDFKSDVVVFLIKDFSDGLFTINK
jgi:hypothetical protein